jgi:hypothetical protein
LAAGINMQIFGKLFLMGTITQPITMTSTGINDPWGHIYIYGPGSEITYATIKGGSEGINDAGGTKIRYTNLFSNTYGLATMSNTDIMSSTIRYNTYGVQAYYNADPVIDYCNIYGNTVYDFWVKQPSDVYASHVWWGNTTPPAANIRDFVDSALLGKLWQQNYLNALWAW